MFHNFSPPPSVDICRRTSLLTKHPMLNESSLIYSKLLDEKTPTALLEVANELNLLCK